MTPAGEPWWEGMTSDAARGPHRLAGQALAAGWRSGRAPELALHRARLAVPVHLAELGGPAGRADLRLHLRRAPHAGDPAGLPGLRLGARRVRRLGHEHGDHRGHHRPGRRGAARPDGHAPVLRLQHGRLLRPLARHGPAAQADPPKIFHVNWFRKDDEGKFLWPGYGENVRMLQWIIGRIHGSAKAVETPIGLGPRPGRGQPRRPRRQRRATGRGPRGRPRRMALGPRRPRRVLPVLRRPPASDDRPLPQRNPPPPLAQSGSTTRGRPTTAGLVFSPTRNRARTARASSPPDAAPQPARCGRTARPSGASPRPTAAAAGARTAPPAGGRRTGGRRCTRCELPQHAQEVRLPAQQRRTRDARRPRASAANPRCLRLMTACVFTSSS